MTVQRPPPHSAALRPFCRHSAAILPSFCRNSAAAAAGVPCSQSSLPLSCWSGCLVRLLARRPRRRRRETPPPRPPRPVRPRATRPSQGPQRHRQKRTPGTADATDEVGSTARRDGAGAGEAAWLARPRASEPLALGRAGAGPLRRTPAGPLGRVPRTASRVGTLLGGGRGQWPSPGRAVKRGSMPCRALEQWTKRASAAEPRLSAAGEGSICAARSLLVLLPAWLCPSSRAPLARNDLLL